MANLNLSEFGEKLFVADADHTFIWDTAASISKRVSRNSWLNSGTLTSDAPVTISQTWNAVGQTFKALVVNAAGTSGTNSAAGSLLLDLQVGGVSKFFVTKNGSARIPEIGMDDFHYFQIGTGLPLVIGAYHGVRIRRESTSSQAALLITTPSTGTGDLFRCSTLDGGGVVNGNPFTIAFDGSLKIGGTDTILLRDSASGNTLALRNGALPQTFNVYGTYSTSPSLAYSRLAIACDTSGNATLTTQSTGVAGTVSINGVPVGLGKGNVAGNVAVGSGVLALNTTGSNNIGVGSNVLTANTTGFLNIGIGLDSLKSGTTGRSNVAIGVNTLILLTSANYNTAVGEDALNRNLTSAENSAFGRQAAYYTTGANNTALGARCFSNNTTGARNLAAGFDAGSFITGGATSNAVANDSIYIGANTKAAASGETNQIVIGYDATGIGSNSVVLGNDSITKTALKGNVGIGTTSPTSNLTVAQYTTGVGTISVGAAGTTVTGVGTQFLNTFAVGQTITSAGQTLTISAIASDTSMTISPAAGAAISGQAYTLVGGTRFTVAGNGKVGIGANVFLEREGDNQLALRNGTAAQSFSLYNTYTNASNHEVGYINFSSNMFNIGTHAAGSGTFRKLAFYGNGIDFNQSNVGLRWSINPSGHFVTGTDNQFDIGASGANRPRNVYVASQLAVGTFATFGSFIYAENYYFSTTKGLLAAPSDGVFTFSNRAATDFTRLQFGGTADTFPAIARDGAGIKFTGAAAGSTAWIKVPPVAVSALPLAATAGAGARAFVNDALAPTFGSAVTGGGAVLVPVYSDGSAWNVG